LVTDIINFILHIDQFISLLIQQFGLWTYAILFLVIFSETGLVVAPFFPGDSLIFVSGTFAATGSLDIVWLFATLSLAAILGDTVNYWIGNFVGPKVFRKEKSRFFKKEYLERAHDFYERHGGKAIVLARFIPVIRTFAPFVAGIGKMRYGRFLAYNVVGGIAWVAIFLFAGYFFGTLQAVRDNLSAVIIAIIIISFIPILVEFVRSRRKKSRKK
jgi:membrane-associated protein